MTNHAEVLREIANLLEDGMPVPINVTLYGKPNILVHVNEIGYWLSRMDLDEPWWEGEAGEPLHARWPDGTFDGHPYSLACVSTANVAVA